MDALSVLQDARHHPVCEFQRCAARSAVGLRVAPRLNCGTERFELSLQRLELGETLIPNKYKELMGVALHAETKCHYCSLFHTEAAKLFGATDEEIQEAVHYAKNSLGWSAYLNGIREDYDEFTVELAQVGEYMSSRS